MPISTSKAPRKPRTKAGTPRARAKAKGGRRTRRGRAPRRRLGRWIQWTLAGAVWAALALAAMIAWFAYDLPDITAIDTQLRSPGLTVEAQDGTTLGSYGEVHGIAVAAEDLPADLIAAVIATEDRRFFDHFGVDLRGIARAMWANLVAGRVVQGGSTLTQQLAKNLFLSPERRLHRKIQEGLLALWLEQRFTKREILTIYLNRVYFGAGSYGIEAAARRYFGKSARDLSLPHAAMIAGLLKAPSRYAPTRSPELAAARAAVVLDNMVAVGAITPAEAAQAKASPARPRGAYEGGGEALYFADWVMEQTSSLVGPGAGDLVLRGTLDPRLQRLAAAAVARNLATEGAARNASQAALVALSEEGAVLAMVGGRRYGESQFNRAVQAYRQPGSAFKLFVYLAALEAGFSPDDTVEDAPVIVDGWRPGNYGDSYGGTMTLAQALAQSSNAVAVRLSETVGRKRVTAIARRLGITAAIADHPSLALGTGEVTLLALTTAYATVANGGMPVLAYGIESLRDRDGRTLYRLSPSPLPAVVAPDVVAAMDRMLRLAVSDGTGRAARLEGVTVAGKTGTSQAFRDAWFIGYGGGLIAGVWVGNDDSSPMDGVTGGGLPARIWRDFMAAVYP